MSTIYNSDTEWRSKVTDILRRAIKASDEGIIASLNGTYGKGKTTFIENWQKELRAQDEEGNSFIINTWEDDLIDTPMESIIHRFTSHIDDKNTTDNLKKLGTSLLKLTTGVDIPNNNKTNKHEAMEKFKNRLKECGDALEKPIFIFVDELDRCRPDYAIKYLEAIKHIFTVSKNFIFIVSVDMKQLKKSAKHMFGQNLCVNNYFLRFFTDKYELPINKNSIWNYIKDNIEKNPHPQTVDWISNICQWGDITFRELKRALNTINTRNLNLKYDLTAFVAVMHWLRGVRIENIKKDDGNELEGTFKADVLRAINALPEDYYDAQVKALYIYKENYHKIMDELLRGE